MTYQDNVSCIGCGIAIQTENPKEMGYAPKSALEKEQVICKDASG